MEVSKTVSLGANLPRLRSLVAGSRKEFFKTGDPTFLACVFYGDVNLKLSSR
jgi:hypothetical protein